MWADYTLGVRAVLDGFFAADRELLRIYGWCHMSPVSERLPLSPTSG